MYMQFYFAQHRYNYGDSLVYFFQEPGADTSLLFLAGQPPSSSGYVSFLIVENIFGSELCTWF
jgi:hypothetical protein